MGDAIDDMRAMGYLRKMLRAKYGVPCPECQRLLPRAHPTILLPQQRCRIHGHRDERPESVMDGEFVTHEAAS